jgi:hypothetical protein
MVAATERLIDQHNPGWRLGGYEPHPREFLHDLAAAGFAAR